MSPPTFTSRCPNCSTKVYLELGQTGQLIDCECGSSFRATRNHKVTRLPIASICMTIWLIGTVTIGIDTWKKPMGAFNQIQDMLKDTQDQMQQNLNDAMK